MKSKRNKSLLFNRKGEQKRDYAQQTKFNTFFDIFIKKGKKEKVVLTRYFTQWVLSQG